MAGLGLMNAVQGYQQGVAWKDGQAAKERQQKEQADLDAANGAFKQTIEGARAKYMLESGGKEDFRPDDSVMLSAAQARQQALARSGNYESYIQGAAKLAPLVGQMRQKALDEFGDDEIGLAKAVYPTFMDGKNIAGIDMVDGTGPDGKPAGSKIRVTTDDGSVKFFQPGQIKGMVQKSVMTPEGRLAEAKHIWETSRIGLKGAEDRKTDDKRTANDLTIEKEKGKIAADTEGVKLKGRLTLAEVENKARLQEIGASGAQARLTKGTPGYDDRNFTLGEGQTRFTLGKDGKPIPLASGAPKAGKTNWTDMAKDHFGKIPPGSISGGRTADANTLALSEAARSIYDANTKAGKDISPEQAMRLAAKQLKFGDDEEN